MTAPHPLGPWALAGDINPPSGVLGNGDRAIKAQCNYVIEGPNDKYLYTGDLWTTALDVLKSHDLQYWYPLEFDDSTEPPAIGQMKWVDSFELALD